MFGLRQRRRRRLRAQPLPRSWSEVIERRVDHWRLLDRADRAELAGHIQVLCTEKHFEGCGGLELSDEMRVTIAAQASLLLLHRRADYFPGVMSILVYPSVYWAPRSAPRAGEIVEEVEEVREGESWERGAVVLAWDRVLSGAADAHSGQNLVLHEFAHQLDAESGAADGAPKLRSRAERRAWSDAFSRAYGEMRAALAAGRTTLLDPYGATNPAEFFAVATETFFERPHELASRHPALYDRLAAFFAQSPVTRHAPASPRASDVVEFWTLSIDAYGAQPIV